jgi:hypothetical protein
MHRFSDDFQQFGCAKTSLLGFLFFRIIISASRTVNRRSGVQ